MAKQKKKAAQPRKSPAKPRKVVEQKRQAIEQVIAAEKLTAHKAAKGRAATARAKLEAERAKLPPNFPIVPFADTLVGREFYARVNCKLTPNKKGKLVNRCDTQRVTVVGGAAPSAERPKTKQVYAVQKGQRYLVPDRELRRAVRAPTPPPLTACETYGDQLRSGRPVPSEAWDECPQLPVGGASNDVSFEPFDFEAPKPNHHGGRHAAGDPLGVYLPPLAQWRPATTQLARGVGNVRVWTHPRLGWEFAIGEVRGHGYVAQVSDPKDGYGGRPVQDTVLSYYSTPEGAYRAVALWYAAQRAPRKLNRAPQGVPGGSYVADRPDAWIGLTVGGDDYAGEIRARAVGLDGAPAHVVGGHVMTRARALAGVRREDIRTGVLPAPTPRARPSKASADRPLRALPPRVPTMRPPPMKPRLGMPALEEARPRPSRFGAPALEEGRRRAPLASAITFTASESDRLNRDGLPRAFTGPSMWQEATAFLREGIAAKVKERRANAPGSKGYSKTWFKVEYPDGFYYEGRYDIGDPIPTDLAEFVMQASKYAARGEHHVPARSGPAMPTPFMDRGGVLPPAGRARPASRDLGHWAVVKAGDQVVLRSGHRTESTLRGTVAEVVHDSNGEPGVVLLDPQRLREGDGRWVPRYEDQRPGDSLRVMRGHHTLEIAPHQPGDRYVHVPLEKRRPWSGPPAPEESRPLPPRAPRPPRFGAPALEERRPLPPRPPRFGAPALEEPRPRRAPAPAALPPAAAPAPRRASDEELMRAMMEELAAAGIVVKQNRRPAPHPTSRRRGY